jgi:hypothetical protein
LFIYLTINDKKKSMNLVAILVISLLLLPLWHHAYAGSSGGILRNTVPFTFHTESDDNANLSYVPGYGNLSNLEPEDHTVGSSNEVNTTINSLTEPLNSSSRQINPIEEYKTNSSDWNIIVGNNPDLNKSFVTDIE